MHSSSLQPCQWCLSDYVVLTGNLHKWAICTLSSYTCMRIPRLFKPIMDRLLSTKNEVIDELKNPRQVSAKLWDKIARSGGPAIKNSHGNPSSYPKPDSRARGYCEITSTIHMGILREISKKKEELRFSLVLTKMRLSPINRKDGLVILNCP